MGQSVELYTLDNDEIIASAHRGDRPGINAGGSQSYPATDPNGYLNALNSHYPVDSVGDFYGHNIIRFSGTNCIQSTTDPRITRCGYLRYLSSKYRITENRAIQYIYKTAPCYEITQWLETGYYPPEGFPYPANKHIHDCIDTNPDGGDLDPIPSFDNSWVIGATLIPIDNGPTFTFIKDGLREQAFTDPATTFPSACPDKRPYDPSIDTCAVK